MAEPAGEQQPHPAEADRDEGEALKELVRSGEAEPIDHLPSTSDLAKQDIQQDIALKGKYAKALLWMMGAQIFVADGVFFIYAWVGVDWKIEQGVIQAWLAATVIQVIGVVLVVTRYLFPRRDDQG